MAIDTTTSVDVQTLTPFKKFIMTIGNLPTSYLESMTYAELLMWFCNYLQETVIPTVNNNAEAVEELQGLYEQLKEYVNDYFDNLDVQEEINNKLDDLVEDGTLTQLIGNYVQPVLNEFEEEVNSTLNTQTQNISTQNNKIVTLENRMNEFSTLTDGSTSGDAELADIRVAFNDITYSNAGDAVSGQATYLDEKINLVTDTVGYGYTQCTLENGTIPNSTNLNYVNTSNYIPITSGATVYVDVKKALTNETSHYCLGWSYYNASKQLVLAVDPSTTAVSPITLITSSTIKYIRFSIGEYDTSISDYHALRKTDFSPNDVNVRVVNADNFFTTNTNNLNTKYNKSLIDWQVYFALPNSLHFEHNSNDIYMKFDNNLINRVFISYDISYSNLCTMLGNDYVATSPSGIENCIKIPSTYKLVYDTQDTTNRIKIISRDTRDSNRYFSYIECVSGNFIKGSLKDWYDNYLLKQEISNEESIPAYWNNEINNRISTVRSNLADHSDMFSFFFITDQHWTVNAQHSSNIIKKMGRELNIPLVLSGGDVIMGSNEEAITGINELQNYIKTLNNGFLKVLSTYGNHDFNNNNSADDERINENQIFNSVMYPFIFNYKANCYDKDVMYFDNESEHIRIIDYNCSIARGESYKASIATAITNLVNELDNTWKIIFLCHTYWNAGEPYSVAALYADLIAGLSHTADAEIICQFVGHVHDDMYTTVTNENGGSLLIISTTTDSYASNNAAAEPPYTMTLNTDTEQAFDIVQIDLTNKKIYMTRVGAGNDREFTY